MTVLPRWVGELSGLSGANHWLMEDTPWQQPPAAVVQQGVAAVKRYYDEFAAHGAARSRKVKMVLVGTGLAGKTSTVRGLKHGEARPMDEADRTIQLDIWTLFLGADESRVEVSAWDLAGQPEYAAAQQQYLVAGALYLLLVPAHKAHDAEYAEVLGRWLDVLQARAPGASCRSCCRTPTAWTRRRSSRSRWPRRPRRSSRG